MQRFEEVENFDVEGVDNKNACYGGTQALMNTINWVESSSWDGRLGIVICAGKKGFFKGHNSFDKLIFRYCNLWKRSGTPNRWRRCSRNADWSKCTT